MKRIFLLMLCLGLPVLAADGDAAESANLISPLLIGAPAPEATMTDTAGKEVKLSSLMGEKPTVVIFYRGSW